MIERDSLRRSPLLIKSSSWLPKCQLYRFHSQALTRFRPRKLVRSLSDGAGEIRTHVLDGMNQRLQTKSEHECRTLNRTKWCSGESTEATWLPAKIWSVDAPYSTRPTATSTPLRHSIQSHSRHLSTNCCLCKKSTVSDALMGKLRHLRS